MSAKAIREYDGKLLLAYWLLRSPVLFEENQSSTSKFLPPTSKVASITFDTSILQDSTLSNPQAAFDDHVQQILNILEQVHPWLLTEKLVAKPDQLIKRRGKSGLLLLNADWQQVKEWIIARCGKEVQVDKVTGVLKNFLVEPFVPHPSNTEYYININSVRDGDYILFTHEGGIEVGDVDAKALKLLIQVNKPYPTCQEIKDTLLINVPDSKKDVLVDFISHLYAIYVDLHFTYLEINPLVVLDPAPGEDVPKIYYLDLAAKLDQTAEFESGPKWAIARAPKNIGIPDIYGATKSAKSQIDQGPPMEFPAPFGRESTKEEAYIQELDSKTGASLKLTILNKDGRIWTMVAGGGFANELANYGEYSGAPTETQTYEYAKTILDLMTRQSVPDPRGKILIIGGGIANFTNVAITFKGLIRALEEFKIPLITHNVKIFVRRGGPNYQEGLRAIRQLGDDIGVEINVYGPETHITEIVPLALLGRGSGLDTDFNDKSDNSNNSFNDKLPESSYTKKSTEVNSDTTIKSKENGSPPTTPIADPRERMTYFENPTTQERPWYISFTKDTRAFVYGMQSRAVQGMLDFDYMCKREVPSVAAMIYPFGGSHLQKFYWGTKETLLNVFNNLEEAISKFPEVDTIVNFASSRSVYDSTREFFKYNNQIKTIAIIAEGVPERYARQILHEAKEKNVLIIGPATVGGIKPGCFKIGNTGGMMDNIIASKLYRPGSVSYVSKSGGMSNELNNIISRTTNGVYEGVAIGGDRYPGSTFIDHLLRFENDPNCKILVLLGEVGGVEEYRVSEAIKDGRIKKPLIAWCIGTCAMMFSTEVQFGHAGAMAQSDLETAHAKNVALKNAGAIVPDTFEKLPLALHQVYQKLLSEGVIIPTPEPEVPKVPIDYSWAQELGLVRKPASFMSTICDDRGQELLYAGMRISDVFKENIGIGGVLSLLWFKRRLPDYACRFIEMILMLTADHGPAGDRFGGALDGAAEMFTSAYDKSLTPREFVNSMRRQNKLILGIGHKVKSRNNPDFRVEIIKDFARKNFPSTKLLDYALSVEEITTAKKDSLILNLDGAIAVCFVDMLRESGAFSREEAEEYIKIGTLNGLFVLGRSIGFTGHYLDQRRLKQGLYRHPWDDISYLVPGVETGRTFVSQDKVAEKTDKSV
ncbi:17327_t:CDS:2 [Gigaspora margarita]|uniref:ATP citrate synthase n=1 Tax=Gigaspora margarita TaxID=4874 RepID=A0ABN7UT71_GIGMA|nr:17327_t:CDS:2 [Gigaspora margarita]